MFVYNITTKIPWDIADEWIDWQREKYIPEIMSTNMFDEFKLYRLLDHDDDEGPTYTLQLFTTDEDRYRLYVREYAQAIHQKAFAKWNNQFIAHRTCMQLIF
jgi:uncharacterized protein DUF4286